MWRKKFYVVLWDGNGADLKPHLVEHLEYMIGLERAGKLFASGPLDFGASSDGLTILRAASADEARALDRKSTRLNSSHMSISYAVFCLKKKKKKKTKK